jgi:hypothetical protein
MESGVARKETRSHLTLQQKAQLRAFLAANPKLPQFAVADWVREHFHVRLGRTTLYRIQSAPEGAFTTGNLSRKKRRRVKFPDFERQLVDFYEEQRRLQQDVPDDLLLRKAAECRAACGIGDGELKLSNGWLYRFKTRHQINNVPPQSRQEGVTSVVGQQEQEQQSHELTSDSTGQEDEENTAAAAVCATGTLSLRALTTVQAPGFFNWEPVGEMQQGEFAIVVDGVLVQAPGEFELSVRVEHSAPLPETTTNCVFRVHSDGRVVAQCEAPVRIEDNVASSVLETAILVVDVQAVLKVEFLAPGYAFTHSSLLLRRKVQ